MLKDVVAFADSVIVSGDSDPLSEFGDGCSQQDVTDLQSCWEKTVVRRNMPKDTSERWFAAQIASFPSASPSVARTGVRISHIVEEGQVEYVAGPERAAGSSCAVKSPVID